MDKESLVKLLESVKNGSTDIDEAVAQLKTAPFEDLGFAKVDHHRSLRQGFSEVIFGERKTPEQTAAILRTMHAAGARDILITRLSKEASDILSAEFELDYHPEAKIAIAFKTPDKPLVGSIVVASGGTSDIPVCEEAALTAENFGSRVHRLYDVGVAGIHRLLSSMSVLTSARVVIAVAGMEGALPSVIGGLVDCPVIAVPTSVGYGANFGGLSALLTMLNSCASGISVVNIDNGFGAGYLANMINKMEGIA